MFGVRKANSSWTEQARELSRSIAFRVMSEVEERVNDPLLLDLLTMAEIIDMVSLPLDQP